MYYAIVERFLWLNVMHFLSSVFQHQENKTRERERERVRVVKRNLYIMFIATMCQCLMKFPFIFFFFLVIITREIFCVFCINFVKLDPYVCDNYENQLVYIYFFYF